MPSRDNAPHRFLVDWSDNDYRSVHSDVTRWVLKGKVQFGANPMIDPDGVRAAHATGMVSIDNTDHRFDPDSRDLLVDEVLLRRRNKAKLMAGDTLLWEGLVYPDTRGRRVGTETLTCCLLYTSDAADE